MASPRGNQAESASFALVCPLVSTPLKCTAGFGGFAASATKYPMFITGSLLSKAFVAIVAEFGISYSRKLAIAGPSKPTLSQRATQAVIAPLVVYFRVA